MGNGDVGEARIGIHEEEILAFGFFGKLVAGPRLSNPTNGQSFAGDQADSGVSLGSLLNQFSGSIRRMVIQDENFKDRIIAIGNRAQTWAEPRFFVPCGDEN